VLDTASGREHQDQDDSAANCDRGQDRRADLGPAQRPPSGSEHGHIEPGTCGDQQGKPGPWGVDQAKRQEQDLVLVFGRGADGLAVSGWCQ
jgi:hypothetical protein